MDGKAQRGDGWVNGQTVKEGRGNMSNQRRKDRPGKRGEMDAGPTRDGGVRSPPPSFDAVLSGLANTFSTRCDVLSGPVSECASRLVGACRKPRLLQNKRHCLI